MEDSEVLDAFLGAGARQAFSPNLHIEGDTLFLQGWWHLAFRVTHEVFIVRNEEPPGEDQLVEELTRRLSERGLQHLGVDFPLIQPIAYTAMSLGHISWALWGADLDAGLAALTARAGGETFFDQEAAAAPLREADFTAELGGARRLAGLPPSVVLTVGVPPARAEELARALPECQVESRSLEEAEPEACGALIPALVLVDATAPVGEEFVMRFRTDACGRFVPVVAVTADGHVPLGADVALDPAGPTSSWVEPLRAMLP